MSLVSRIFIYYILISLTVFAIGGAAFYYSFRKEIYEELDEHIRDEKRRIERLLKTGTVVPEVTAGVNFYSSVIKAASKNIIKLQRKDTLIFDSYEGNIPYRQWRFTTEVNDQNYLVVLRKSVIDLEDLLEEMLYSLLYAFIAFLLLSAMVNYLLLKKVLHPFREQLRMMKRYTIDPPGRIDVLQTNISEFRELNDEVIRMTEKIQQDYRNIKEFSENASHEIQTPLAIIRSKLELLIQNEHLNKEQASLIQSVLAAANRLSQLNKALILLTRIENREFSKDEQVDLTQLLTEQSDELKEQVEMKGLSLSFESSGHFVVAMNRNLAVIMIANLLVNSIRHNYEGGKIIIEADRNSFSISNTGRSAEAEGADIFQRFKRSAESSDSLGIGLSLVKKICDVNKLHVSYSFTGGLHKILVSGSSSESL